MLNDRKIWRELGALLRLGWPLCVAQLLQVSMGFVDTVMVGRLGALELAAIGLGSAFWVLIFLACVGSLMAISPIVAQHFGAGRPAITAAVAPTYSGRDGLFSGRDRRHE